MPQIRRSNFSRQRRHAVRLRGIVNQSTIEMRAKECFCYYQWYIAHSMFQRCQTFRTVIKGGSSLRVRGGVTYWNFGQDSERVDRVVMNLSLGHAFHCLQSYKTFVFLINDIRKNSY